MSEDTLSAEIRRNVMVPMRDGVDLSTDIYLPASTGPFPALLMRTIYDKTAESNVEWVPRFVERGYAVVMQDCRGKYASEGEWEAYVNEAQDGFDCQEWIGAQPWCDGGIGMFGASYDGFTQSLTAPLRSRYLKAPVPTVSQQDNYGHWYIGGALQLHVPTTAALLWAWAVGRDIDMSTSNKLTWRLPLISAVDDVFESPFIHEVMRRNTFDDFWKSYSMRYKYGEVATPALFVSGWYDNLLHENFKLYKGWTTQGRTSESRSLTKLLVGPWSHGNIGSSEPFGDIAFGDEAEMDFAEEQLRWYDRRLKNIDNGMDDEAPIHVFVMGENIWRFADSWPLPDTQYTSYYLHSDGDANSMHGGGALSTDGPGDEPADRYSYDPRDPVPTLGGQIMASEQFRPMMNTVTGPWDRRPVEGRNDVLVYSTEPLQRDVEVTGPVSLTLHASSSSPDTDFTGTLVDVHPDGKAIIICEGLLRARFRESIETPSLIEPGRVYELTIDMWETSNMFKSGHRIRLEVSSSNHPRFDRNLNTGNHPATDTEMRVAQQTIHHDSARPSHLTLPVIPG